MKHKPAVLVVTSGSEQQSDLEQLLRRDYRVTVVDNCASATTKLSRGEMDLLLIEAELFANPEIASELSTGASKNTPCILILEATTETDLSIWERAYEEGVSDVVRRPLDRHEVLTRVRMSLRRSAEANESARLLRREKSRLEMALIAARMVAIEWDLVTDEVALSENAAEILGPLPPTIFENSDAGFELVHPDDRDTLRTQITDAIAKAGEFTVHYRVVRPDSGDVVWIEQRGYIISDREGQPLRLIAVAADVTSRRNAEFAIEEHKQYLEAVFNTTPECIKVVAKDGRLQQMNAAGLAMIEAAPDQQIIGRSVYNLIAPEFLDEFREFNRRVCEGESGVLQFQIVGLEGTRRYMETHAVPLRLSNDEVVQLALTRDISERKRAEEVRDGQARVLGMIAGERPLSEILTQLVLNVEKRVPQAKGSILLADAECQHLRHGAAPGLPDAYNEAVDNFAIGPCAGSCGTAAYRRQQVIVADVQNDPLWAPFKDLAAKHGLAACWSEPILSSDGTLLGTFAIYFEEPRTPNEAQLRALREFGTFAAIAIERAQAQSALRESETRFRALTSATSDVIFRMNADWSQMQSLDGREFIVDTVEPSQSWLDTYVHPDDQSTVQAAVEAAVQQQTVYELEHRVIRVDGTSGWMHSRAVPIVDEDGQVVEWFGAATDVTERKNTEQLQKQITKTLLNVIEQSPLGIYLVDSEFRVARVSLGAMPAFQNVMPVIGRDLEEVMHTLWPDPFASETVAIFRHTLETGEPYVSQGMTERRKDLDEIESYEWQVNRITLADGSYGVVCYFFDSTRLQQAAAALRESEERFRMLADNMSQLAWTGERLGEHNWYNQRWYEYTGTSFDEMRDDGWKTVHHPDHLERVIDSIQRARAAGQVWEDTFPLRGRDGQYRWFLSRAVPIRNDDGEIVRWFGTNTDITELRKTQQLLHDADRRKDEFLAMLAHELRNPLAPIRSGLDILSLADDDEHRDTIRVMQEQVAHVVRLVDDLLDVSRIMRGKVELRMERIELESTVRTAVDAVQNTIQAHGHELSVALPAEPVWLEADPVRVVQILENLLNNATKYMDGSGVIELAAEVKDGIVSIHVSDEGIGIEKSFLPKIFDLFAQSDSSLDRSKGGLGIGLTLVKQLVEMHRGEISVESDGLGHGSRFQVDLPVSERQEPAKETRRETNGNSQRRRIVVVDDNESAAMMLTRLLQKLGDHEIQTAHDGQSALDLIRDAKPEIVFLDIGLPGISGYEVASQIRQEREHNDMLLIALTGYGQTQDRERSQAVGFDEHLVKPPSIDMMKSALSHPKLEQMSKGSNCS